MKSFSKYCILILSEAYTLQTLDVILTPIDVYKPSYRRLIDGETARCIYGEEPRNIYMELFVTLVHGCQTLMNVITNSILSISEY